MGLFNLFKKSKKVHDEFFGTLTLMEFKDPAKNHFEGAGFFKPIGREIEYIIEGGSPTTEQKQFYDKVQNEYDEIAAAIAPLIEEEFRNVKEDFKISDFKTEFNLMFMTVPDLSAQPFTWDLAFDTIHDANHQVTVAFKNFDPEYVLIDG